MASFFAIHNNGKASQFKLVLTAASKVQLRENLWPAEEEKVFMGVLFLSAKAENGEVGLLLCVSSLE
jgi:hypothetical protein